MILVRRRQPDGSLGLPEKVFPGETDKERMERLDNEKKVLQAALAETIEKQESDRVKNQLAMAELLEKLTLKGVI